MDKFYGFSNDYAFKKIMNKKHLCKQFLNDIFDIELNTFEYVDKESVKENKHFSYGICDIVLKTDNEIIIIEMQNTDNQNIENRAMMYLSKMYVKQWEDNNYEALKPVTICLILNYQYDEQEVTKYQMMEIRLKKKFGNNFNVKIWNTKVESKNKIINKYRQILNPKEEQIKKLKTDQILKYYVKELIEYNMNLEEYQYMKERELMHWTYEDETKLRLLQAKYDGVKEGKLEEKIETIKNMLSENFSIDMIMKATKLSKKEIERYIK